MLETLSSHPPDRIAVRVGALDISYARLVADVMAAATTLAAKGVAAGRKVGIRAGTVSNGHSYANWVAHLAMLHLGAAHVSIVEAASLGAAVQAGMIDLVIGARGSLDDIPPALERVEFACDPARPLATTAEAPAGDPAAAARISDCRVPIEHRAGDAVEETIGTKHWWRNEGSVPVLLLLSDIAKADAPAALNLPPTPSEKATPPSPTESR